MEIEEEFNYIHLLGLKSCCRVCGHFWPTNKKVKGRFVSDYTNSIRSAYGLDVTNDIAGVHPRNMCVTCYRKMGKLINKGDTDPLRACVTFTAHKDNDCDLCQRHTVYGKGMHLLL